MKYKLLLLLLVFANGFSQISIIDCTCKIVFNKKTNENKIDVSELQNGIYFVIGKNSKGELFENKLIKN